MLKRPVFNECIFTTSAQVYTENNVSIRSVEFYNHIYIGYASYMGSGFIRGNTKIGRYCSIGKNVKIGLAEHSLENFTTHPLFTGNIVTSSKFRKYIDSRVDQFPDIKLSLEIGNDVWIGDDALIMKGLKIGHGSVIGANSVVTKDIPPYAIVIGSPAKILRYRFNEDIIDKLLNSKWWDIHPATLSSLTQSQSVEEFIDKSLSLEKSFQKNYLRYTA